MPGTFTGPPPTGQSVQQLAPAPPAQQSKSSTAADAATSYETTNYETPKSRFTYGPPHTGFSRNLLPMIHNLESIPSPSYSISGATARLDLGARRNYRVIKK